MAASPLPTAAAGIVLLATPALSGYWTYLDATARGSDSPLAWAAVVALLLPVAVPVYLYRRRQGLAPRSEPMGRRERAVGTVAVAGVVALAAGTVAAPPDPVTQTRYVTLAVPVGLIVGYTLVWAGGARRLRGAID